MLNTKLIRPDWSCFFFLLWTSLAGVDVVFSFLKTGDGWGIHTEYHFVCIVDPIKRVRLIVFGSLLEEIDGNF